MLTYYFAWLCTVSRATAESGKVLTAYSKVTELFFSHQVWGRNLENLLFLKMKKNFFALMLAHVYNTLLVYNLIKEN